MRRRHFATLVVLAILLASNGARAEDDASGVGNKSVDPNTLNEIWYYPGTAAGWNLEASDQPTDVILKQLQAAGWNKAGVNKTLNDSTKYDLYKMTLGPGVDSYMVVPKQGANNATPVVFGVGAPKTPDNVISANWFGGAITADQIKKEILDGIQATIDAVCELPKPPSTLRIQVSAVGVVEMEATWTAADVCRS